MSVVVNAPTGTWGVGGVGLWDLHCVFRLRVGTSKQTFYIKYYILVKAFALKLEVETYRHNKWIWIQNAGDKIHKTENTNTHIQSFTYSCYFTLGA